MMPSREFIVSEIKRVAKKNNRAPGMVVFERETGIRKPEWYGIHWRSWSAALIEAGFEPNKKQGKLDAKFLLQKYVEVIRYHGKIPAEVDLRMYARDHADFPAHSTYANHFGNKDTLLRTLRDWLEGKHEYSDVFELIPDIESSGEPDGNFREGFVYLLQSGAHYKIGRSEQIERRVKEISISMPEQVDLIHTIRTDDPSGIETYWHRRFADKRANGEWFNLSKADVRAFKRRRFQ